MKVAAKRRKSLREMLPEMEVTGEDLEEINAMLNRHGRQRSSVMNILHDMQNRYHYLPKELMEIVSRELDIPYNQVFGLGTFFDAFFMKPLGKYRVDMCMGTTCYNQNASEIMRALEDFVGVKAGDTREDGLFTLLGVHCIGCCSIAPALRISDGTNEVVHGLLTPEKAVGIVGEIEESEARRIQVTEGLIRKTLEYLKRKGGRVSPSEAAEELGLDKEQFKMILMEMQERGLVKRRGS
jgi:NADH:ubiquinone oxidoreductase subunit E